MTTCSPKQDSTDCIYAGQALYEYAEAVPDNDALFTISLQASPWRMYDGEMRILTADDVADAVRPKLDGKLERVELIASWTDVSPEPGVTSHADRVSMALGGFPVKGEDGFLWLAKDGTRRTTRQAFTTREGAGSYYLPNGSEVFAPLVAGWPAFVQDQIPEDDADMLTRAAAGWTSSPVPGEGARRLRARRDAGQCHCGIQRGAHAPGAWFRRRPPLRTLTARTRRGARRCQVARAAQRRARTEIGP